MGPERADDGAEGQASSQPQNGKSPAFWLDTGNGMVSIPESKFTLKHIKIRLNFGAFMLNS
jgi:hypothetical protein